MKLWECTEFAALAEAIDRSPQLTDAWRLGVCDQTIADLLGVGPDEENVPELVRNVAVKMMRALTRGGDFAGSIIECAALLRAVKEGAN